jgi:hypothetical protein
MFAGGVSGAGGGKWEVGSGKWEVGSGKWEVGSGKWEVGSGNCGKWEPAFVAYFLNRFVLPAVCSRCKLVPITTPGDFSCISDF